MLFAASELEGAEDSLLSRLKSVETSVGRIAEVYPRAEEFYARLHAAALDLKDLASEAASGADVLTTMEKAKSHYGQWDAAAKYIDPRQE